MRSLEKILGQSLKEKSHLWCAEQVHMRSGQSKQVQEEYFVSP